MPIECPRCLQMNADSSLSCDCGHDLTTIVRRRLNVYYNETSPVADHYRKTGKFQLVKGEGSVEEIFNLICETIDKNITDE